MDAILLNRASGGGGFDDAFMDSKVFNLGPCCSMGLKEQIAGMSSRKDISPSGNLGMVSFTRPFGSSGVNTWKKIPSFRE